MKKVLSFFTIVFCLFSLSQSCKKNNTSAQNSQTISVTIKAKENYQYELGTFGDEEGASIIQQAQHYDTSIIERKFATATYKYKPLLGYIGTDEVKLKSERGSEGASPNNKIIITTIKFTITN
jgi:hypothetical protein